MTSDVASPQARFTLATAPCGCAKTNIGEADTPTYAAVTSRSFHTGGVNAQRVDGSVSFVRDSVSPAAWRALSTRAGGEVVGDN